MSDLSDLARKRVAVAAYYFVPGLVFASWASRIPDVKHLLHLNNGQLGSILLAIPLGQLLMMGFSGVLVSKLGSKKMLGLPRCFMPPCSSLWAAAARFFILRCLLWVSA